jgi:hypothetical protein
MLRTSMLRNGSRLSLLSTAGGLPLALALTLVPALALAQGQALPPIKVNLPPTPNFDAATGPVQHPTGELSVYGVRKQMSKYMDKDVRVKGYLLYLYECPPEIRKCNEEQDAKAKKERRKGAAKGAPPAVEAPPAGGCRPCEQPHFFISDQPNGKLERALLVADYPIKDWKTGRPKPLAAKQGEQYVVTGTFAINSITGFAASNGLLVHKRTEDAAGKVVAEGNAVLPPEAQTIQLEGKPVEKLAPAGK